MSQAIPFLRLLPGAFFLSAGLFVFLIPGLSILKTVFFDKGLREPGGGKFAFQLHRNLCDQYPGYVEERLDTNAPESLTIHQIAETEWPLFGATFFLWATESLQETWEKNPSLSNISPKEYGREAINAATALVIDPGHATWVKKHWGEKAYLESENVFYRMLVISSLTAHHKLTRNREHLPFLKEQITSLAAELDASPYGLLDDYPGQCYPSDVSTAIAAILNADPFVGTDHSKFAQRALRGFTGNRCPPVGLPPFAADSRTGQPLDLSRGCGNSNFMTFAPLIWPEKSGEWFDLFVEHFWQENWFLAGFREFPKSAGNGFHYDVDSGPVIGGFGMSASSFGSGAARVNGRFDIAYPLSAELVASSWPLPNGILLMPRLFSNSAHAPLLGESAIAFQLSRQPMASPVQSGSIKQVRSFVYLILLFLLGSGYFITKRSLKSLLRHIKFLRASHRATHPASLRS